MYVARTSKVMRMCVCVRGVIVQMSVLMLVRLFVGGVGRRRVLVLTLRSGGTVANEVYLRRGYC